MSNFYPMNSYASAISIAEIFGFSNEIPPEYKKMMDCLGLKSGCKKYMPSFLTKKRDDNLSAFFKSIVENKDNFKYAVFHQECLDFISSLHTPNFDIGSTKKAKKKYANISNIDFRFIEKTKYSCSKTSTGRMTVVEGFNILTAPAELRSCIRSKYKNGKIMQIDLVSAEPKFALFTSGKKMPKDVYDDISSVCNLEKLTRQQVKMSVICSLYGQSSFRLSNSLPGNFNSESIIRSVKKYFSYNELLKKLTDDHSIGNFRNFFGRPLATKDSSLLISHYLQSSVADCSLALFKTFCKNNSDLITPYYLIHDALIFDASPEFLKIYSHEDYVDLQYSNIRLMAKISEV